METFLVEIEKEINKTLHEKSGLVPYFSEQGRYVFEHLYNHKLFRHCFHCMEIKPQLSLLRKLIKSDDIFENSLFFILFKAFVYAEARFIHNFIPQNSHEERLTGHLMSEYLSALNIVKKSFQEKAFEMYNENVILDFHYADLSSNKRERTTGADFGIVFHINLPDYPEEVKAAIFQAKKIGKNVRIDIEQYNTLLQYGKEGAYYCFYDMNTKQTSSPLVLQADEIYFDDKEKKNKTICKDRYKFSDSPQMPLSVFLIFNMLSSENSSKYKKCENLWDAKNYFAHGDNDEKKNKDNYFSYVDQIDNTPNKILIVSIGGIQEGRQDLRNINDLYRFPEYED
ncbi:MAG: hypothetical protein LBU37_03850 [Tannerellaceae bacterium]|jgi:hypothetical protein|nr:hypothetical protein [Tannerellaceae bacterium]